MKCYLLDDFVLFHYNFQTVWMILYIQSNNNAVYTKQEIISEFTNPISLPPFPINWDFSIDNFFFQLQNLFEQQSSLSDTNSLLVACHISIKNQFKTTTQVWLYDRIKFILSILKKNKTIQPALFAKHSWNLRKILNSFSNLHLSYIQDEQKDIVLNCIQDLYGFQMTYSKSDPLTSETLINLTKSLIPLIHLFPNSKAKDKMTRFLNQNLSFLETSNNFETAIFLIANTIKNFLLFLDHE